jgi:SAM-dependent methyltransferase
MEAETYLQEDLVEADHWWFKGRRRLFGAILRQCEVGKRAAILDAGTSSGNNLRLLRDLGFESYRGLELSAEAIAISDRKGLGPVERGDICAMPFSDGSFDFVLATDIIEHVEDDDRALSEIRRVLKPGGRCLITVPAFPSLWGHQDVVSHHKRRYRSARLLAKVEAAGLRPLNSYHFNYLLFLPIWAARQVMRAVTSTPRNENSLNAPLLNVLLGWIFAFDVATAPHLRPPFGVSLLVLCERRAGER